MGLGNFFRRSKLEGGDEPGLDDIAEVLDEPLAAELDEIGEMLSSFENRGLEVFGRHGLPTTPGAYRCSPSGEWEFLAASMGPQDRWNLVLEKPPEAGWRYAKLADVGRHTMPQEREVMAAVRLLDAVDEARREGLDESGGFDPGKGAALKAGMRLVLALEASARFSRQKLYAPPIREGTDAFSAPNLLRRNPSEERQKLWRIWCAEAVEIWRFNPHWGSRAVAMRIKKSLGLPDSVHTVRRRILEVAPSGSTPAPTDEAQRSGPATAAPDPSLEPKSR